MVCTGYNDVRLVGFINEPEEEPAEKDVANIRIEDKEGKEVDKG